MTDANGRGNSRRAVLYARVSTGGQAQKGYSIPQQLEALREYAAKEGYEVIKEVTDPGQSGATLDRPGMDEVRDLVAAGGVSAVFAQDRDRFAREPALLVLLKRELAEYSCKLKALNDHGDDSPEGELADGILDQVARYEKVKIAERTRRGKLRKAREGKVIAGSTPNYGFRYNAARDGYEVDEATMQTVRRILRMVGEERASLYAVKRALEREGVPTPKGNRYWSVTFLRSVIMEDAYKPHTAEEVAKLVSAEVAARLDEDGRYGIWWFNRFRAAPKYGREQSRMFTQKPEEEWIAVPVPDSGVRREWVDNAREIIKYNRPSKNKHYRYWELTGGILYCGECGRRMTGHSMSTNRQGRTQGKRRYYYYVCPKKRLDNKHACANKNHRAEPLEERIAEAVTKLFEDPARLEQQAKERIEREREAMRDPEEEISTLTERLEQGTAMRRNYQDQQAAGYMTLDELGERLDELDETRETLRRELEAARDHVGRIEELERERMFILGFYVGYAHYDVSGFVPEERRRLYEALGLKVVVNRDRDIEVRGDVDPTAFPSPEKAYELMASMVGVPEHHPQNDSLRAMIRRSLGEHPVNVMSVGSTSTCSACST